MNRSMVAVLGFGLAFVATPAWAQQPLQPAPAPQSTFDPYAQQPQAQPLPQQQPMDPYAQYGEPDEEDDSMDVTYDISTSADPQEAQYDDGYDPNAYQQFESQLAPYGTWQDVPDYGHVWVPSTTEVGYDFEPYATGGNFVYSDYGWTWASDYGWGWAPFHYGRWAYSGGYGWCWIPGTTWGPGWVNWRWGGGYVGWSPMGPRGRIVGPPRGVRSPWHFTVANQLGLRNPHLLPSRAVASVWRGTTPIHNVSSINLRGTQVRFNAGPSAHMVAAATGRTLAPTPLHTLAPRALPNQAITPHVGTPLGARPWMQQRALGGVYARSVPGSHTLGSSPVVSRPGTTVIGPRPSYGYRAPQPMYRAPTAYGQQPVYRAPQQPMYRAPNAYGQPAYRAPTYAQPYHAAPTYRYNAPAQSYGGAPSYRYSTPAQSYHPAPSVHYSAPMQSYHAAPSVHYSAPASSFHPSGGGFSGAGNSGFHGGGGGSFHGGGGGFHGGGHR